ncbi:cytochrome P450 [Macrophomina phaseolina]|uniref:Cytochrome P450 n=1 Tax=Macrophomina phaseolina TaxID=35725 RepID=A0ABQ8FPS8_9PEZI|nr:cytochrome P450 [Macrophomina phaseolina]
MEALARLWLACIFVGYVLFVWVVHLSYRGTQKGQRHGSSPPRIQSRLPFGLDLAFLSLYHLANNTFVEWSTGLMDKFGRTIEMNMPGGRVIITDDPENIRAIQSSQALDGPRWQASKRQLSQHFGQMGLKELEATEAHVQNMLPILRKGAPVDVYDIIERYQMDIVTAIYMGKSTGYLQSGAAPFRDALSTLLRINSARLLLGKCAPLVPDTVLCPGAIGVWQKFMDSRIDDTLALPVSEIEQKEPANRSFVEKLAVQGLSRQEIKSQLLAIFLAAKPSAIVLSWALYELSKHPEDMKRLRNEVLSIAGTQRCPTLPELQSMRELRGIVNETMRLYHPLGLNLRVPLHPTTLPTGGGPHGRDPVDVTQDTQIIYSVISLQRRAPGGPDPGQWRPQRWEHWEPQIWEYIPFNHGPRICLGRKFGRFQVEYALARIAQEFSCLQLHDCFKQRIKLEVNTQMAYPVHVSFHE